MIPQSETTVDRNRFLSLIQKEVERMQHLLSAVREISLLDSQLEDEARSSVEVGQVLKQVIEARRIRENPSKRVQLIDGSDSLVVSMAPERLIQVLENLHENALSFAATQVRIELLRTRTHAVISFEDDGPGIPVQHLDKIFDRFFSYRPTEVSPGNGGSYRHHLGLGLAIVKAVVEGYGGDVKARSGPADGKRLGGARIILRIPLAGA